MATELPPGCEVCNGDPFVSDGNRSRRCACPRGCGGCVKQQRLPLARNKLTLMAQQTAMQQANVGAARIILASRERYAGVQVEWAEKILALTQSL